MPRPPDAPADRIAARSDGAAGGMRSRPLVGMGRVADAGARVPGDARSPSGPDAAPAARRGRG